MKPTLLLFGAMCTFGLNAQRFTIHSGSHEGQNITGDTLVVNGLSSTNDLKSLAYIRNNENTEAMVQIVRYELKSVSGTANYYCYGMGCAGQMDGGKVFQHPSQSELDNGQSQFKTKLAQATDTTTIGFNKKFAELSAHYLPNGNAGTSIYKFVFYDEKTKQDSTHMFIKCIAEDVSTTGREYDKSLSFQLFPNPANEVVNIVWNKAEVRKNDILAIQIHDIFGRIIKTNSIHYAEHKSTIETRNLQSGIYFSSLLLNGEIIQTKKMVVRH